MTVPYAVGPRGAAACSSARFVCADPSYVLPRARYSEHPEDKELSLVGTKTSRHAHGDVSYP